MTHIFMYEGQWCVQLARQSIVVAWDDIEDAFEFARLKWIEARDLPTVLLGWPAQVH